MKQNTFLFIQSGALLAGTIFAWTTVVMDFMRFYGAEGTVLKIQNCVYPNPVTTACFYGAIAFLVAFVWSLQLFKKDADARRQSQKYLTWFLFAGTIFAWSSFGKEWMAFSGSSGEQLSCSGVPADSPFHTSCFYGSVLFAISFVVSVATVIWNKKRSFSSENSDTTLPGEASKDA